MKSITQIKANSLRVGYLAAMLLMSLFAFSQDTWTWMKGDNTSSQPGVYGTQYVPPILSNPGARQGAITWTDASGNQWLFGGSGYTTSAYGQGFLSDLWKYDHLTNVWTLVKGDLSTNSNGSFGIQGVAAPSNRPSARSYSATWLDDGGNLWLFGGSGIGSSSNGYLSDLWKFDITTSNWTWMKGSNNANQFGSYGTKGVNHPSNLPGSRFGSYAWIDAHGDFWLFGGVGYAMSTTGSLNDLWRYNKTSNEWTWISGSNNSNVGATYGVQGTASISNIPSGRYQGSPWLDPSGNLWLFGGNSQTGNLNDLWKFNPGTNEWTWMKGDNFPNAYGNYATYRSPSSLNKPGARVACKSWKDGNKLWLLGGSGFGSGSNGTLNDLWYYDLPLNQWVWVHGDVNPNQNGVYGTIGVATAGNKPGSRHSASEWIDGHGFLWVFGGVGYTTGGAGGNLNDLWKFDLNSLNWTWVKGSNTANQYSLLTTAASPTAKPGARADGVTWTDKEGNLWLFGGEGYASSGGGYLNDLWYFNKATNTWSWIKGSNMANQYGVYGTQGVSASSNTPGARYNAASWIDNNGDLWLYGGQGYTASSGGFLGDLWRFSLSTYEWTWMHGDATPNTSSIFGTKGVASPTNKPGSKNIAISFVDTAGKFWLFGGQGASSMSNDLWKYDPVTNNFTYINGSFGASLFANFGSQGVAALSNIPGARVYSSGWADETGNLWVYGGSGYNQTTSGYLSDLWKFNINTNLWTWMQGVSALYLTASYGTKKVPSISNTPGSRAYHSAKFLNSNNAILFGGSNSFGYLNDLWSYNASTNRWTWISGDNAPNQADVFGTQGISNPSNKPGARYSAFAWVDNVRNFWFMGGRASNGYRNDLWKYQPNLDLTIAINSQSGPTSICLNETGNATISLNITPTKDSTFKIQIYENALLGQPGSVLVYQGSPVAITAANSGVVSVVINKATLTNNANPAYANKHYYVYAVNANDSIQANRKGSDIVIQALPTVTLTGGTCLGEKLSFTSSTSALSAVWKLNGSPLVNGTFSYMPNGVVVAGGNGQGAAANQFNAPMHLKLDANGDLIVVDRTNNRVQKWTYGATTGTTVAGGNGPGNGANQLNSPTGVTVDASGNVYVSEYNNNIISMWAPGTGTKTTVGTGLSGSHGLVFDASNNLYAVDYFRHSVNKFTNAANPGVRIAGTGFNGGAANQFYFAAGLFVDAAGNLYVADNHNNRIQKWAPGASVGVTVAGGNGQGAAANQLYHPQAIYVDANGHMYIVDTGNNRIVKWMAGATSGVTIAGGNGVGNGLNQLNTAYGIDMDFAGNLYVADGANHRVLKYIQQLTTTQSGLYTVEVTTASGCVVNSNVLQVNPIPTATVSGSTTVCQSTTNPLATFVGSNGTAPYSFNYTVNGGNVQTIATTGLSNTVTLPISTIGLTKIKLVGVTDVNNCSRVLNDSVMIVINPSVAATITTPVIGTQGAYGNVGSNGNGGQLLCNEAVVFNVGATVASGQIVKYILNYGDGSPNDTLTNGGLVKHRYPVNNGINWFDAAFPNTRYTIQLQVVSDSGCAASASINRDVKNGPEALIGNFSANTQVLSGNSFQFHNQSQNHHPSFITSSQWSFGDGTTSSNTHPTPKNFAAVGNYEVGLVIQSGTGCTDTTYKTVSVIADTATGPSSCLAVAGFYTSNGPTTRSLNNNSFDFFNTTYVNGFGWITSYTWDFGDGTTSTNTHIYAKTYSAAGTYNITLTAVLSTGCTTTYSSTVTVTPSTSASFVYTPNTCGSFNVAFNSSASQLATSYIWNFGDGNPSTLANPSHAYATAGSYAVTLTINGNISTTQSVIVVATPTAAVITPTLSSCGNVYTYTGSATGTGITYSWAFSNINGTGATTGAVVTRTYNATGIDNITLTATSGACATSVVLNNYAVLQAGGAGPVASFTSTMVSSGGCNTGVQFTSTSTGATTYTWNYGDGTVSVNSSNPSVFHAYAATGTYTPTLTASNGSCSSTSSALVVVTAIGNTIPEAAFTITNRPAIQCITGNRYDFFNTTQLNGWGWVPTYYWNFGDGTNSTNTHIYGKTYSSAGTYTVTVTAVSNLGCSATASMNVTVNAIPCAGMVVGTAPGAYEGSNTFGMASTMASGFEESADISNKVGLYPNPTTGNFRLTLENVKGNKATIKIIDMLGREVYLHHYSIAGVEHIDIQDLDLAEGKYNLILESSSNQMARKFFVVIR
jgi:PKD repeat protein